MLFNFFLTSASTNFHTEITGLKFYKWRCVLGALYSGFQV